SRGEHKNAQLCVIDFCHCCHRRSDSCLACVARQVCALDTVADSCAAWRHRLDTAHCDAGARFNDPASADRFHYFVDCRLGRLLSCLLPFAQAAATQSRRHHTCCRSHHRFSHLAQRSDLTLCVTHCIPPSFTSRLPVGRWPSLPISPVCGWLKPRGDGRVACWR